jgi:hypothetical protein
MQFTSPAARLWEAIPADTRKTILANVWCGICSHGVTITNFSGAVKGGDLLLSGSCSECQGPVARLIEVERSEEHSNILSASPNFTEDRVFEEMKALKKQVDALNRRRRQLSKKWDEGSITKKEKAELDRLFGKDGEAVMDKFGEGFRKLTGSILKR